MGARTRYLGVYTKTERKTARKRKGTPSLAPELDGYLLKQLRVLITYDYKFNRTSFVITASSRERITVRDISFCHIGPLRYRSTVWPRFIIYFAKVVRPPTEDWTRVKTRVNNSRATHYNGAIMAVHWNREFEWVYPVTVKNESN